jgi:hypothetical protein
MRQKQATNNPTTVPQAIINQVTGRKRRRPLRNLDRRVRSKGLNIHRASALMDVQLRQMGYASILEKLISLWVFLFAALKVEYGLHGATVYFFAIRHCMPLLYNDPIRTTYFQYIFLRDLDFEIGDMTLTEENEPIFKCEPRFVKIDNFENDDEDHRFTNFDKADLRRLNIEFGLPTKVKVHTYSIHWEALLIYFLIKNASGLTHAKMSDAVTHGCVTQLRLGYNYMLHYLDQRYRDLIGPHGIEKWGDQLPQMAKKIRVKIGQDRWWYDTANQQFNQELCAVYFQPGEFSVAGFVDCKDWKICRPGSGPNQQPFPHLGAKRIPNWYTRQRSFFGGHHQQHAVKTLAFTLPNGMTAAVFGPCSSRRHDLCLLDWSQIDLILSNFQSTVLNLQPAEFFTFYGDTAYHGMFAWLHLTTTQANWTGPLDNATSSQE